MSEPYLLAASLLTGLVIPTSTIPQSPNLPKDSLSLLDLAQGFQSYDSEKISPHQIAVPEFSSQTENSSLVRKSLAKIDTSLPEFSRQTLSKVEQSSSIGKNLPRLGILLSEFRQHGLSTPIKSSFNFNSQITPAKSSISGSQLYQQRLAALRSGQIYTRTDNDENSESSWESDKAYKLTNYLNIHNWFTGTDGNLRPELTTDGLHLSPAGYQVWQFALEQIEYRVAQIYN